MEEHHWEEKVKGYFAYHGTLNMSIFRHLSEVHKELASYDAVGKRTPKSSKLIGGT